MKMKKVKEIRVFGYMYLYNNLIIVKNKDDKSIQNIDEDLDLTLLIDAKVHSLKILDNKLFYQVENCHNLHIYDDNIEIEDSVGYALHSALKYDPYIYIYGGKDDDAIFLDSKLQFIKKAPEYCNFSYNDYLLENYKNTLFCYKLSDKQWEYTHSDDSKIQIISGYKDKVLIYSENGDLFALNLNNGELCWEFEEKCYLHSLCGDNLYTVNKYKLVEIDAETGRKKREIEIKPIEVKENFYITRIKVYDDYIFCTDTFGGTVAVIDRKTLELKEILRFEKHLINWEHSLHWVNNRLYVQDTEYVIHIFE